MGVIETLPFPMTTVDTEVNGLTGPKVRTERVEGRDAETCSVTFEEHGGRNRHLTPTLIPKME